MAKQQTKHERASFQILMAWAVIIALAFFFSADSSAAPTAEHCDRPDTPAVILSTMLIMGTDRP